MGEAVSATYQQIDQPRENGRIIGELLAGEEVDALVAALIEAPSRVSSGTATVLVHAGEGAQAAAQRAQKRDALARGRLGRYVLALDTQAGRRIIKITEVRRLGNALLGLVKSSTARREHRYHLRTSALGLAATRSLGFLELRVGLRLTRCCQLQTPLDSKRETLETFLPRELSRFGLAALTPLGQAIAEMHNKGFFHADLKAFHAYVCPSDVPADGPTHYDLEWIDLARVSFRLSRRQRIINLYQALRFLVPPLPEAHRAFITAYTQHARWHADAPERALGQVQRLLAYKYRTHPIVT